MDLGHVSLALVHQTPDYGSSHLGACDRELKLPRKPAPKELRGGEFERGVGALERWFSGADHICTGDSKGGVLHLSWVSVFGSLPGSPRESRRGVSGGVRGGCLEVLFGRAEGELGAFSELLGGGERDARGLSLCLK